MIRRVVVLLLTGVLYVPMVGQQSAQAACGVWRWPVKTLSDPDRTKVDFTPIGTSVAKFRTRSRPAITFNTDTPEGYRNSDSARDLRLPTGDETPRRAASGGKTLPTVVESQREGAFA